MAENYKYAIGGIIATLLVTMTYIGVTGKDPSHYCLDKNITIYCESLSSTGKTCYQNEGNKGGKVCNSGWKEIFYEKIEVSNEKKVLTSESQNKYLCYPNGCIELKK